MFTTFFWLVQSNQGGLGLFFPSFPQLPSNNNTLLEFKETELNIISLNGLMSMKKTWIKYYDLYSKTTLSTTITITTYNINFYLQIYLMMSLMLNVLLLCPAMFVFLSFCYTQVSLAKKTDLNDITWLTKGAIYKGGGMVCIPPIEFNRWRNTEAVLEASH